ncbi:hypothetical protein ACLOJK_040662 [Asimina triloba]
MQLPITVKKNMRTIIPERNQTSDEDKQQKNQKPNGIAIPRTEKTGQQAKSECRNRFRSAYLPLDRLVQVPEDVSLDDVQPSVLGFLDELRPHLHPHSSTLLLPPCPTAKIRRHYCTARRSATHLRRAPRVMYGAGYQDPALAVDHQRPVVIIDGCPAGRRRQSAENADEKAEEEEGRGREIPHFCKSLLSSRLLAVADICRISGG